MPNVMDVNTKQIIKEFPYTEEGRDAAEAFASRSENYRVVDQSHTKPWGGPTLGRILPSQSGDERLGSQASRSRRFGDAGIAPDVPGGNPIAGMVNPNPITSVDPANAQRAMQMGAPTQQFRRGETSQDFGGGPGMVPTDPRNVGDPRLQTASGTIRRDARPTGQGGAVRRPAPTPEEIQRRLFQLQQQRGGPLGPQG
jgi:hypothetical protein